MKWFDNIMSSVKAAGDARQKMERELEDWRQERDNLVTAPLPLDEHLARINVAVDRASDQYLEHLRRNLNGLERDPFAGPPNPMSCFALHSAEPQAIQRTLFALFPDEVKAGIRRLYEERADWSDVGPPLVERQKRIAELDEKIASHETMLEEMSREADAVGLRFGVADAAPRPDLFRGGRPTDSAQAHRVAEMDRRRQGEKRGN